MLTVIEPLKMVACFIHSTSLQTKHNDEGFMIKDKTNQIHSTCITSKFNIKPRETRKQNDPGN